MLKTDSKLTDYLTGIKAGDMVYACQNGSTYIREVVDKTTKTQIVTMSGHRFKIADGYVVGGIKWQSHRIVLPTAEVIDRWQADYLGRWAVKSFPSLFATLPPVQQLELYRYAKALAGNQGLTAGAAAAEPQ